MQGGSSTEQEMCLAFVLVYPAIPMTLCASTPRPGPLLSSLGIRNVTRDRSVLKATPDSFDDTVS